MIANKMYKYYQELARIYGINSMHWLKIEKGETPTADEDKKFLENEKRITTIINEIKEFVDSLRR